VPNQSGLQIAAISQTYETMQACALPGLEEKLLYLSPQTKFQKSGFYFFGIHLRSLYAKF